MMSEPQSLPPGDPVDARSGTSYTPGDGASLAPPGDRMTIPPIETAAEATVRARMPVVRGWRDHFRDPFSGRIYELDFVFTLASRWRGSELSMSADWRTRRIGPFVIAVRLSA